MVPTPTRGTVRVPNWAVSSLAAAAFVAGLCLAIRPEGTVSAPSTVVSRYAGKEVLLALLAGVKAVVDARQVTSHSSNAGVDTISEINFVMVAILLFYLDGIIVWLIDTACNMADE